MTLYTRQQASSYATLERKGAAVTFTLTTPGTYDAATDTWSTPTTATVTGYAVAVGAEPELYKSLELIQADARSLLFAPTTAGTLPALNSTVTWGGVVYTVKHIIPLDPDGTAIVGSIVVAR